MDTLAVYISSLNLHYLIAFLCKTLTYYSTDSHYFNRTLISGIMVYNNLSYASIPEAQFVRASNWHSEDQRVLNWF